MAATATRRRRKESVPRKRATKKEATPKSELLAEQPRPQTYSVMVRKLYEETGPKYRAANIVDAFKQALDDRAFEKTASPKLVWWDDELLCAVDADLRSDLKPDQKPTRADYYRLLKRLPIKPLFAWITHGGGLRLVFGPVGPVSARGVCRIAVHLLQSDDLLKTRVSGWEIKTDTRHPHYIRVGEDGGEERCEILEDSGRARNDPDRLRCILFANYGRGPAADEEDVAGILESLGMEVGGKYQHDRCLIDRDHDGGENPIRVLDAGIYCHACANNDRKFPGESMPGMVHWSTLLRGEEGEDCITPINHFRNAIRGRTHREHCRYYMPDEATHRDCLRLYWLRGEDAAQDAEHAKLIDRVFYPKIEMIRVGLSWVKWVDDGISVVNKESRDLWIDSMPGVKYIKKSVKKNNRGEEIRTVYETGNSLHVLAKFKDTYNLTAEGYPDIVFINGFDLAEHVREDNSRVYALRPGDEHKPYYIPQEKRTAAEKAKIEAYLRAHCPGINLELLYLIIAMEGVWHYGNYAYTPLLILRGQSGAAKSAHVALATNILGGRKLNYCDFGGEWSKYLLAYAQASMTSPLVYFDEYCKAKLCDADFLRRIVSVKEGLTYHPLYLGAQRFPKPGCMILSDVERPDVVVQHEQIARRSIFIDLGAGANAFGKDWGVKVDPVTLKPIEGATVNLEEAWRQLDAWNTRCASFILSEIQDRWFCPGQKPNYFEIAAELGFSRLAGEEDDPGTVLLRELYNAAIATGETTIAWFKQRGKGQTYTFRTNEQSDDTPAEKAFRLAWRAVVKGPEDISQKIEGANWTRISKVPGLRCKHHDRDGRIGLRFYV